MDLRETSTQDRCRAVARPDPARRRRAGSRAALASARRTTGDAGSMSLQARSPRGELLFRLRYHLRGLYVERDDRPCAGPHCVQSMRFEDVRVFAAWCDDDPARFEYPLLHAALKREAAALWQSGDEADA